MSFEIIIAYVVFFLFILMIITFTYVIFLQNRFFKRDHRMNRIQRVWEDLVLNYLMSEEKPEEIILALKKSIKNSKTVFYKFLFRFFETMSGDMGKKLNELCRELELDQYVYNKCLSPKEDDILKACSFIKYIRLNSNDMIIIELLEHESYFVRMAALELLPKFSKKIKFEILFRQINDIPHLTTRKKLQILEKFGSYIYPDIVLFLQDPYSEDYHKSVLIELLVRIKYFKINHTALRLFKESNDNRLKRKILDYFTKSKNKRFLPFLLHPRHTTDTTIYLEILKYFNRVNFFDEELINLFFFRSNNNKWAQIEIIKLIKKQFTINSFKFVDNGVISNEFSKFMQKKRLCYLTS